MTTSMTEKGWAAIFKELAIPQKLNSKGIAFVSAPEIRKYSGREPRLMSKFDSREERPRTLRGITVLPIENGRYALIAGDGYSDVETVDNPTYHPSNQLQGIESLPWQTQLTSESQVIDSALLASMIGDFTGEDHLSMTIRGRLRTPRFCFKFQGAGRNHKLTVDGVQVEVDAGYEGDQIYVLEAKMGGRSDFIVRQLYYPYRMWMENDRVSKAVVPLLLTYSNRTYSLRMYRFTDPELYNSIELVKATDYLLEDFERPSLSEVLEHTNLEVHPEHVPFPQADSVAKLIDLVDAVAGGVTDKEELADQFDYDVRQSDYYGNAARYLGLVGRRSGGFRPLPETTEFAQATLTERLAIVMSAIASRPVFRECVESLEGGTLLSRERVAELIQHHTGHSTVTSNRRAGTVQAWMRWVEEYKR